MTSSFNTAQRCAEYLRHHGTVQNWQKIILHNYAGKFAGYRGGPNIVLWKFWFEDSALQVHQYKDEQEQKKIEIFIGNKSVVVI